MTDQITVPRKTWDATLEALDVLNNLDADINFLNTNALEDMMDKALTAANAVSHPQSTEPASCHQTGVCVRSGLAAENHARLIECARRLVEHADFALGGILSADSKAKDIPSKAVSQVKSRHLAALRDALPAAPEAKQ